MSLRFINNLDACLGPAITTGSSSKLVDLLLSKMPTISKITAEQFVVCFLAASKADKATDAIAQLAKGKDAIAPLAKGKDAIAALAQISGPISLMMQAALCTEDCEAGIDFPDFISSVTGIPRAYDGPPALRIAAWCCHMRTAGDPAVLQSMAPPATIFDSMLVDQYGFPLQLKASATASSLSEGHAFSWNGDYSRMSDIIDAV